VIARNGIRLRLEPVGADGSITGRLTAFSGPRRFTARAETVPAGLYDGRVTLSDGTTIQRTECFEVPPPGCPGS
jgi:hypothetical protein